MKTISSIRGLSNYRSAVRLAVVFVFTAIALLASKDSHAEDRAGAAQAEVARQCPVGQSETPACKDAKAKLLVALSPEKNEFQAKRDAFKEMMDEACKADAKSPQCLAATNRLQSFFDEQTGSSRKCTDLATRVNDSAKRAKEACSKGGVGTSLSTCYSKVKVCEDYENEAADEESSYDNFSNSRCNTILLKKCPQLPEYNTGENYKQDEKDAERERKDAKRDLDSLNEQIMDLQNEGRTKQREFQEEAQNANQKLSEGMEGIAESVKSGLKDISNGQKKAYEDAQSAYLQMDAEYAKMRAAAREKVEDVYAAQDNLELVCRGVAEKKYKEADKARLAAKTQGKKNVGSASGMAGQQNRKASRDVSQRNADYMAFYNECKAGLAPEGREALNRISAAERGKVRYEQQAADQALLMEKQRAGIKEKLVALDSTVQGEQKSVVEQAQKQMDRLNQNYNLAMQQNQARMQEFQANQQNKQFALQSKIATAQNEMNTAANEALMAKRRGMCTGGNVSETRKDKISDGRLSAVAAITEYEALCKNYKISPECGINTSYANMVVCESDSAIDYYKRDGKTKYGGGVLDQ